MGQFLPEVRGVFNLIELHKKDLERSLKLQGNVSKKGRNKVRRGEHNAVKGQ